jgi:hypothetical protein
MVACNLMALLLAVVAPVDGSDPAVEAAPATATEDVAVTPAGLVSVGPDESKMTELKRYFERKESAAAGAETAEYDSGSVADVVPPQRPPWVDVPAFSIGTDDYVPVDSGPYATRGECRRALAEAMRQAVAEYVQDHRGDEGAAEHVVFETAYVKTHLRQGGVFEETVQASFGPMRKQHALLKFGQEFRAEIDRRYNQVVLTSRLAQVALLAASVLVGLGIVFVYLQIDTATRGYYTGRLQFTAGAVILGIVALGVLLARWVPWL